MASEEAPPSAEEVQKLPDEERLKQAAVSAQKALDAQSTAQSLRNAASSITDKKKREKLLRDAYDKEIEAHGNSKKARMFQSGAFQGAAGGGGIGAAVGVGVGTVVGTLVGGITSIPTTGLGALVGSGVGAVRGPFIKLPPPGGDSGSDASKKEKPKAGEKNKDKEKEEEDEDSDGVVPDPEALRKAADAVAEERTKQGQQQGDQENSKERRKPRKIEIRSGKKQEQE